MNIKKIDYQGRGITYYKDKIMFVTDALIGEDVVVDNIEESKKNYTSRSNEIKNKSVHRITPKCPYYHECGGCHLAHMDFTYEAEFKKNKIKEILKKYANLDIDIKYVESNQELFYRNKISLKIESYKWGYYNNNTHELCSIDKCLLARNSINDFFKYKNLFKIKNGTISIRTNYKDEIMLIIETDTNLNIEYDKLPSNIIGIILNNKCIYGNSTFIDKIGKLEYKLSYDSFFQINNYIASCIIDNINSNIKGNKLLDLYCGVGTLGIGCSKNFDMLYGIEKVNNAIVCAKENALLNNIKNSYFYSGDTAKVLKNINKYFDTIIIDPPRSGLNKETINKLILLKPKTICYVSCDPMTLARDIKRLDEYKVEKVYAFNMFPRTYHVECMCLLKLK